MSTERSVEDLAYSLARYAIDCTGRGLASQKPESMIYEAILAALRAERNDKADRIASLEAYRRMYAAKVPPGHIMDDQGVVRKVLGTLFTTKEGDVVADGGRVYFEDAHGGVCEWDASGTGDHVPVEVCYSTREAAEAAAKEVQGER